MTDHRQGATAASVLDAVVDRFALHHRREQIHALVRPAMLLVTRTLATHDSLEPGRSRLGGLPDLPPDVAWPRHRDGRPLAFLGQVDLAQVAGAQVDLAQAGPAGVAPPGLPGFPSSGLLSLFSVYGWRDEEGGWDPFIWNHDPDPSWTRVVFIERPVALTRTSPPGQVNVFPAAAVTYAPHAALPTSERERALAALEWPGQDLDALEEMLTAYHELVLDQQGATALSLLGGYAVYEQEAVSEVVDEDMRLLVQIGADQNASMSWGDGGYLYVWIRSDDLAARRFERVVVRTQCG